MDGISGQSFIPLNIGRVDDEDRIPPDHKGGSRFYGVTNSECGSMKCVIQMPNVTLWYGVPCLLYLMCQYLDGQFWLWMMLELPSNDIPCVLNWRQIW
ncbi:hypothetical protein TNCV_4265831 [Trichonephila clavipes]|nr:hypothetical protein TNCV_4265831 [Trichonephila clavipes]